MFKSRYIFMFITIFLISLSACDDSENGNSENEICDNEIDDDDDGFVDCDDPDCADFPYCQTNNSNCEGDAPLADLQAGVCQGAYKVCDASSLEWVNPDYTEIEGYEAEETTCDGIDNDCDSIVDAGPCQANSSCEDEGQTVTPYCLCDPGWVELLTDPGVCHEALQPQAGELAITEVMLEPTNSLSIIDGQYFEVYNTTDATMDLSDIGFYVTDTW
ncbi:MAG: hypothetical protein PF689_09825 [Deltaproteobacteria bacterium]|jgi:hypothetical protein|nr:hypothetical protein [Deltaproteobacteria bacterium]